jgi:hypothetical protein
MDDKLKEELSKLADKNALTLSGLFRWLGTRAVDGPEQFGLLPVKQEHKQ